MLWFTKSRRAQTNTDYETWIEGGAVPTLNAFDNGDVRATAIILFEDNRRDGARLYEKSPTLQGFMGTGGNNMPMIADTKVRRLTPIECERLQGFPDNWTASQADSNRYKQMGNAVTVNVIQWIGKRI
jgi:DNA (cytosine-5)-methyltransferase 1